MVVKATICGCPGNQTCPGGRHDDDSCLTLLSEENLNMANECANYKQHYILVCYLLKTVTVHLATAMAMSIARVSMCVSNGAKADLALDNTFGCGYYLPTAIHISTESATITTQLSVSVFQYSSHLKFGSL